MLIVIIKTLQICSSIIRLRSLYVIVRTSELKIYNVGSRPKHMPVCVRYVTVNVILEKLSGTARFSFAKCSVGILLQITLILMIKDSFRNFKIKIGCRIIEFLKFELILQPSNGF